MSQPSQRQSTSGQTPLAQVIAGLRAAELDWDAEKIADWLWLSRYVDGRPLPSTSPRPSPPLKPPEPKLPSNPPGSTSSLPPKPSGSISVPESRSRSKQTSKRSKGIPFSAPMPPALRQTLALGRSLRPLMRKVDSYTRMVLDETATAERTAEQRFCMTVERPEKERWLELALVIEVSGTTVLWEDTIRDFRQLLERQGAFRSISTWYLQTAGTPKIRLLAKSPQRDPQQQARSARELLDASGRRLIFVVSDCISAAWRQPALQKDYLDLWASNGPLAVVQLLPGHLWQRTMLRGGLEASFGAWQPGATNRKLFFQEIPLEAPEDPKSLEVGLKLPVVTMDPSSLEAWAKMLAGGGQSAALGVWFDQGWRGLLSPSPTSSAPKPDRQTDDQQRAAAKQLVDRFFATGSGLAWELSQLMAVVPVSLPIIYLLQETMLRESQPLHLAEVFMSGLVKRIKLEGQTSEPAAKLQRGAPVYEFLPYVRDELLESVDAPEAELVMNRVAEYIGRRIGKSIYSFTALLRLERELGESVGTEVVEFARVTRQVLRHLGGDHAAMVDSPVVPEGVELLPGFPPFYPLTVEIAQLLDETVTAEFPALQTGEVTVATIVYQAEESLQRFEFETATMVRPSREAQWQIQRQDVNAYRFVEQLAQQVELEMVQIPAGSFTMGSPADEPERLGSEGPQHDVTLQTFFIGRYPITQAQWRAVVALEQVEQELDLNLSSFKGDSRPVEQVSWEDATEFCRRLSRHSGRDYRLPTEAEWEYACRAGTTTPFHFGEMITTDLANYNGDFAYADGPKGIKRQATTDVGEFPANAWGVSDTHGNVWEWCQDHYHDSYKGAPEDGTAWVDEKPKEELRILRGGSWVFNPRDCRSARRNFFDPSYRFNSFGFRVVCVAPRTG